MKKRSSRILSLALALCLVTGLACVPASAEEKVNAEAGQGPKLEVSQSEFDLGVSAPGSEVDNVVDRVTTVLWNVGDAPVEITYLAVDYENSGSGHGLVYQGTNLSFMNGANSVTLAPGDSLEFDIEVELFVTSGDVPGKYGSFTTPGTLDVGTAPAPGEHEEVEIPLSFSYEILPPYEFSETEFDWGEIPLDEFRQNTYTFGKQYRFIGDSVYITLTNRTGSTLRLMGGSHYLSTDLENANFSVQAYHEGETNSGVQINDGKEVTFKVSSSLVIPVDDFDPNSFPYGTYTASGSLPFDVLSSEFNPPDVEVPVTFTYTIVPPASTPEEPERNSISVTPASLDFGTLTREPPMSQRITVTNTGTDYIELERTIEGQYYSLYWNEISSRLYPGQSGSYQLHFTGDYREPGVYDEDITITSSSGATGVLSISFTLEGETAEDEDPPEKPGEEEPDVPEEQPSSWAVEQVSAAVEAGLVPDSLQAKYTQTATRAEFCALAVELYETVTGEEITQRATFSDTTDVNVQKMAGIGVISGIGNNQFNPNGQLTREQAATILVRLAVALGKPLPEGTAAFADNSSIASWAIEAVGRAKAGGIMDGTGNNMFSPQGAYTREQSIMTAYRLYETMQ